jgi:hypothetical protein
MVENIKNIKCIECGRIVPDNEGKYQGSIAVIKKRLPDGKVELGRKDLKGKLFLCNNCIEEANRLPRRRKK